MAGAISALLFGAGSSPVDETLSGVTPIGSCGVPSGTRRVAHRWSRFRAGTVRCRAVRPQDLDPFGGLVRRMRRARPPAAALRGRAAGVAVLPSGSRAASRHRAPSGETDRRWRTPRGLLLALERSPRGTHSAAEVQPSGCTRANAVDPVPPSPGGRAVRCGAAFGLCRVGSDLPILRGWRESYALGARQGQ
jgi:hypothetical protein